MITILSVWLKKVIFVILLAVFLDLLLPTSTMQRYVRLVMGLVVVVTMLSPVMAIANYHLDPSSLSLDRLAGKQEVMGLAEIFQRGDSLRAIQEQQALDTWRNHIVDIVTAELQTEYGVTVNRVNVTVADGSQAGKSPEVKHLIVELSSKKPAAVSSGPARIPPIQPVQPVQISVNSTSPNSSNADETNGHGAHQGSPEQQKDAQKMREELSQQLQLAPSEIDIQFTN